MILTLFVLFLVISLALIIIGLFNYKETGQALIGFFFLFLLGLTLLNGNLEYKTGDQINKTYSYLDDNATINIIQENRADIYSNLNPSSGHTWGFWLCLAGVAGMVFSFVGLKGGFNKDE